jgi:hypothetical protein
MPAFVGNDDDDDDVKENRGASFTRARVSLRRSTSLGATLSARRSPLGARPDEIAVFERMQNATATTQERGAELP